MSVQTAPARSRLALRLTLLSTAAFAVAAMLLLVAEYFLLQYVVEVSVGASVGSSPEGENPGDLDAATVVFRVAHEVASAVMWFSTITAVIMVILAGLAVWLVARRSLGRVAEVTNLTKRITGENLDQQLQLTGPRDEIKDLGDTIDDMLRRLHGAFEQQDRFVANASHELRTPIAGIRASLEASLLHDNVPERPTIAMRRALDATGRSEHILAALLTLARSRRIDIDQAHPVDLREATEAAVEAVHDNPALAPRTLRCELAEAAALGDTVLIVQAIHNLVENAVIYGAADEPIDISTSVEGGNAVLNIINGGPVISPALAERLVEPFNRGERTRTRDGNHTPGTGLGLSIVHSIAHQHDGTLSVTARPDGGLHVKLSLPTT